MKRLALSIILLALPIAAATFTTFATPQDCEASYPAPWSYQPAGNGYWLHVNADGSNDGWYYTRRWHCGQWRYYYSHRFAAYENNSYSNTTINYSNTWKEQMVKQLGEIKKEEVKLKDSELFVAAVKESGLKVNPMSLPNYYGGGGYGGGYAAHQGVIAQGLSVLTQGIQGNTVYGVAQYSPQPSSVDLAAMQRNALRFQERSIDAANTSAAHTTDALTRANDAQVDLAKFSAAVQGVLSAAQATVTPRTETHQWQTAPAGGAGQAAASGANVSALAQVKADVVMGQKCLACHSGANVKGGVDFSAWPNLDAAAKAELRTKVADRVTRTDDKRMPPPDKHGPLTGEEIGALLSAMGQ